jgi:salicylate hydroxylase
MTVFKRHAQLQLLGSAIGFMPSGARVLEQYGVLEEVWRVCGDSRVTMYFCRWVDGSVLLSETPAIRENVLDITTVVLWYIDPSI